MNHTTINHQPLFGKNSNVIHSPKNSSGERILGSERSLSPLPPLNIHQQPSSVIIPPSSSITFSHPFPPQSPIGGNISSPFNMLFSNSQNQPNNLNHNPGLISSDTTPLRLMHSPLSTNVSSSNNISSIRSNSLDTQNTTRNHTKSISPEIVTKSYKFNDNIKDLHKTVLYVKEKKSFVKSKKPVDVLFFELLQRVAGRNVSLQKPQPKKARNNSVVETKLVNFNGNDENSHIIHISNNQVKPGKAEKTDKKQNIPPATTSQLPSEADDSHPLPPKPQAGPVFYKECDLCSKGFDNNQSYKLHKKQHVIMNNGKNVCPKCYKGFARTDAMKRHFGTKTCERNRKRLIAEHNGVMPNRPPTEVILEQELNS